MELKDVPMMIRRTDRKTLAMQMQPGGTLLIRAPLRMPTAEIDRFILKNRDWVVAAYERAKKAEQELQGVQLLSMEELKDLADQAQTDLAARVKHFAPIVGVRVGRITIRNQRTRWGSCSAKGNVNFNVLLMLTPEYVRDYVVVHELCHRLEMNHSPRFWAEVGRVLPDYVRAKKWLTENGAAIMRRMTG